MRHEHITLDGHVLRHHLADCGRYLHGGGSQGLAETAENQQGFQQEVSEVKKYIRIDRHSQFKVNSVLPDMSGLSHEERGQVIVREQTAVIERLNKGVKVK